MEFPRTEAYNAALKELQVGGIVWGNESAIRILKTDEESYEVTKEVAPQYKGVFELESFGDLGKDKVGFNVGEDRSQAPKIKKIGEMPVAEAKSRPAAPASSAAAPEVTKQPAAPAPDTKKVLIEKLNQINDGLGSLKHKGTEEVARTLDELEKQFHGLSLSYVNFKGELADYELKWFEDVEGSLKKYREANNIELKVMEAAKRSGRPYLDISNFESNINFGENNPNLIGHATNYEALLQIVFNSHGLLRPSSSLDIYFDDNGGQAGRIRERYQPKPGLVSLVFDIEELEKAGIRFDRKAEIHTPDEVPLKYLTKLSKRHVVDTLLNIIDSGAEFDGFGRLSLNEGSKLAIAKALGYDSWDALTIDFQSAPAPQSAPASKSAVLNFLGGNEFQRFIKQVYSGEYDRTITEEMMAKARAINDKNLIRGMARFANAFHQYETKKIDKLHLEAELFLAAEDLNQNLFKPLDILFNVSFNNHNPSIKAGEIVRRAHHYLDNNAFEVLFVKSIVQDYESSIGERGMAGFQNEKGDVVVFTDSFAEAASNYYHSIPGAEVGVMRNDLIVKQWRNVTEAKILDDLIASMEAHEVRHRFDNLSFDKIVFSKSRTR